jgi:hypothetical protein
MAIAAVLDFDGGTLEQYDECVKLMGLEPGGDAPPNALFHWVTDSGVRVTDVWESQEAFDKFGAESIGPIAAKVGLSAPTITIHDVHNYFIKK